MKTNELNIPANDAAGPVKAQLRRWVFSNSIGAVGLIGAGVFAFVTTWVLLSPSVASIDRDILIVMIVANVVIAAIFMALIGARLWHVWSDRRNQIAGSKTQLQLVGMFSLVAAIPALIAFIFAFTVMRTSWDDLFSGRIDSYVDTSVELARAYFNLEANSAYVQVTAIEVDLKLDEQRFNLRPTTAPIAFKQRQIQQTFERNLAALYLLDGNRSIISRTKLMEGNFKLPSEETFSRLDSAKAAGEPRVKWYDHDTTSPDQLDFFRAILKIDAYDGGYIVIYTPVPDYISERLLAVRDMRDDWSASKTNKSRTERVFVASYILLAIIILFGAIWMGLRAATRMVQPIGRLIGMSERVSSGELDARIDVQKSDGELGVLARSMNHMTAQLQTQRNDLIETNRQFDTRRRFTEAVLSGVSAGVVGVSESGIITIANRSAADLIGADPKRIAGHRISKIVPELEDLFEESRRNSGGEFSRQIEIVRDGHVKTTNARIASDTNDGERSFVVTFDDITQLVDAQRSAAWGDVARRIAHEIKNPLTPIQLSAERLRRKYSNEIKTSPEIFDKCTETIIRQVNDIGRMVDEFSSFARMPKPVIEKEDMLEIIKSSVFPQKVAFPDIEFLTAAPDHQIFSLCDGRLIVQALSNVLKNAGESVSARLSKSGNDIPGKIHVTLAEKNGLAIINIIDNGIGLPKTERHRLTEPYMTTRAKGTGLGLAIVKKVIEDHGGSLRFHDDNSLGESGAQMTLSIPVDGTVINDTRADWSAAAAE